MHVLALAGDRPAGFSMSSSKNAMLAWDSATQIQASVGIILF
jgi:hypothetical protein